MKFILSNNKQNMPRKIYFVEYYHYLVCARTKYDVVRAIGTKIGNCKELNPYGYCYFGDRGYDCKFLSQNLLSEGMFAVMKSDGSFFWMKKNEKEHIESITRKQ